MTLLENVVPYAEVLSLPAFILSGLVQVLVIPPHGSPPNSVCQKNDFFERPDVIGKASGHRWSDSQRLVDSSEIVIDGMNRDHSRMVLDLLGKAIRKAGKPAHPHPHCQIVPLHIASADVLRIGITAYGFHLAADTIRSADDLRCGN